MVGDIRVPVAEREAFNYSLCSLAHVYAFFASDHRRDISCNNVKENVILFFKVLNSH